MSIIQDHLKEEKFKSTGRYVMLHDCAFFLCSLLNRWKNGFD